MIDPLPDNLTFEEALARLEQIVNRLEEGDLTLEDSVAMFEQGQQLTTFCQGLLDSAELRVQQLDANA
ncbi:MAG: exodeoxyribonuclease VII small subunit [Anaerolineae bacterium]|nr:exodeoxyribonuclease VII small subunit [Anaerolineae bacterium]